MTAALEHHSADFASGPQPPLVASTFEDTMVAGSSFVSLQPFWAKNRVDYKFTLHRIPSQATRFQNAIVALPTEASQEVTDLLLNPPATHPYGTLKPMLM